jgi:uncharacterized LabA/DUF88 family protein
MSFEERRAPAPRHARIALLIDADNSPADKIDVIIAELAKLGVANIRRAYGNWKKQELKGWEKVLHEFAIRPVQQFDVSKGKNATDMLIAIDAVDLLYGDKPDAFGIVSSDADFTPLVMHLRAKGATVWGFGAKKTPMPFVNACSSFLYLETLGRGAVEAVDEVQPERSIKRPQGSDLRRDAKLVNLLRGAAEATAGEDGWSNLSSVRNHIENQAPFDPRNYQFRKFSDLVEAIGLFDIDRNSAQRVLIRDRRGSRGNPLPMAAEPSAEAVAAPAPSPASRKSRGKRRPPSQDKADA